MALSRGARRSTDLALPSQEVHWWTVEASALAGHFASLAGRLSPDERARAERFRFEEDRRTFAICRGLLRTLLGHYLGRAPEDLVLAADPLGKPYLVVEQELTPIHFNVSHSHGRLALGFSRNLPLGIDIEQIRPLDDLDGLARRYFAPQEQRLLDVEDIGTRRAWFFAIWALKEAYLKGTGRGLTTPLDSFHVSPREAAAPGAGWFDVLSTESGRSLGWTLLGQPQVPGFAAAVAAAAQVWTIVKCDLAHVAL